MYGVVVLDVGSEQYVQQDTISDSVTLYIHISTISHMCWETLQIINWFFTSEMCLGSWNAQAFWDIKCHGFLDIKCQQSMNYALGLYFVLNHFAKGD